MVHPKPAVSLASQHVFVRESWFDVCARLLVGHDCVGGTANFKAGEPKT